MADRATLMKEANAKLWSHTGYKIGKPLDPKIPADKAMAKLWTAIFDQLQKEDKAGTLVMTHYEDKVLEALADAEVASNSAAKHLQDAAAATDPQTKQQHATAAAAAVQTATAKAREARAGQPLNVPPEILQAALREAAGSPLPASAPAADQIAHVQMQNGLAQSTQQTQSAPQNGQRPSEAPSREALFAEANNRFWRLHGYKIGKKLDMSDPQDRMMAEVWTAIFHDVEREAREGRLATTAPSFGVPQDPYAAPQGFPQPQPQYGAYGAPPGLTPPQYAPQPQPSFPQQPQYGAYGAPPGLTPQYGAPQGFPQAPQYGAPQEMPMPQYAASQQVTSPQYGAPQDFSQYGAPQGFPQAPQYGAQEMPMQQQTAQAPSGFPGQEFQAPQAPQQQSQPQQGIPQTPQVPVPRGMEGFPQDLLQYEYAQQQAAQQQQQVPQQQQAAQQQAASQQAAQQAAQQTQRAPQPSPAASKAARPAAPPSEGMSTWGKVGLAALALGGLSTIVYAATRSSHARVRKSYSRDASPSLALLPSRGWRY